MQVFRVGGSVRDEVMGLQPKDIDYVVVGSTPEEMIEQGFTQVGADFPVFLDSEGNEFALARTERKVAAGHRGFKTKFDPSVTLEEDLVRRDFTMNAMAVGDDGQIVDPFDGQSDIRDGIIRHVSEAFAEDPLRVLRAGRFAARFFFSVAPETLELMKRMVAAGELNHLTPERVWKETSRAIMEVAPHKFFNTLKEVGASDIVFGDAAVAFEAVDARFIKLVESKATESQRWAAIFSDVGDDVADVFIEEQSVPNDIAKAIKFGQDLRKVDFENPDDIMSFLNRQRLWSDQTLLQETIEFTTWSDELDINVPANFVDAVRKAGEISFADLSAEQREILQGPDIGEAISTMRREVIEEWQLNPLDNG